jgi:F420-0:gamma-glutamyl ligase-like protein
MLEILVCLFLRRFIVSSVCTPQALHGTVPLPSTLEAMHLNHEYDKRHDQNTTTQISEYYGTHAPHSKSLMLEMLI